MEEEIRLPYAQITYIGNDAPLIPSLRPATHAIFEFSIPISECRRLGIPMKNNKTTTLKELIIRIRRELLETNTRRP